MSASGTAARRQAQTLGTAVHDCPLCDSNQLEYEFVVDKSPVCRCHDCGLLFLNPPPANDLRSASSLVEPLNSKVLTDLYRANATERLHDLVAYTGNARGTLVLVGADDHMRIEAEAEGFQVTTRSIAQLEAQEGLPDEPWQACVLYCALERTKHPIAILKRIRERLISGGTLMAISPTVDTAAARLFKHQWWEFNRTNLFYFSIDTLQSALIKAGFVDPLISPDRSLVSLNYVRQRIAATQRQPKRLRWVRTASSLAPFFRNRTFRNLHSRTRFLVRSGNQAKAQRVSVIVPVYNEKATCVELLDQLLAKTIPGIDIEVVIVESNSTDGSRELVLQYQNHPRVKLILEPKPMGKGHAVRTALKAVTGDIVLFQDADLEYDLNDYEGLLEPVLQYRHNFVLGSRHTIANSSWKIRNFSDAPGIAGLFNFGHLLFLTMFNTLYGQKLTDPFTMFKVFRRECLYGLFFESNRFDFDYEIVIKFLRKGYVPKELPVNYTSRSLAEGKKVTIFRDPLTWIRAMLKFKRSPLYGPTNSRRH